MNCVSRSRPCSPCWTQPKARDHQRLTAVYGYTYNRAIEQTLERSCRHLGGLEFDWQSFFKQASRTKALSR